MITEGKKHPLKKAKSTAFTKINTLAKSVAQSSRLTPLPQLYKPLTKVSRLNMTKVQSMPLIKSGLPHEDRNVPPHLKNPLNA